MSWLEDQMRAKPRRTLSVLNHQIAVGLAQTVYLRVGLVNSLVCILLSFPGRLEGPVLYSRLVDILLGFTKEHMMKVLTVAKMHFVKCID
jgi:hypothetical protein